MLTVHILASGSEGNSLLVSGEGTHVLLDAGISARRITAALRELGLSPRDLSGVLLTHEHSDHVSGLATLVKQYRPPLYATVGTARAVCRRVPAAADVLRAIPRQGTFDVGDIRVTVFPTSHDAAESVDYRFDCGGSAVGVLTDTGCVPPAAEDILRGVGLMVLESNHDVEWLRSGPYPYYLKERILGMLGHLSNDCAAAFAAQMAACGTQEIVLAHLSKENNTPVRALDTMQRALRGAGFDIPVSVAPRAALSGPYRAEVSICRR